MYRSVKSLLSVSVLVPAAALAVAAAPAHAAPGPSTELLYEGYAEAAPVTRALPESVTRTAGQTAEKATHRVDGVLGSTGAGSGLRANPDPLGGAVPTGDLGGLTSLLGNVGLGQTLGGGGLREARQAESPVSLLLTDVPATLGAAGPAGLPVGTTLFPPNARAAKPGPTGDLLGQADGVVDRAGGELDEAGNSVSKVVRVLKASERTATKGDGPVSLLDSSGVELPAVPGLG
ncbi:hypothetical protein [Actinomadura livida]|uniref:ATP-binding protein n=1 Tax=Actinomadura livida TaxID=79909 RepID=A0A7W7IKC9_9ACTN|nr:MULTISPECIES: hypothetical protein [Actinomadura]MBB4778704.1 hypothetical protein [Actinomadura catellatispora]GGU36004.1 hypothetical protein GCM10010208_70640 [Actinomadura livida]